MKMLFDQVFANPKWKGMESFCYSDKQKNEINKWLAFIKKKKQLKRYCSRMTKQGTTHRDEALAEISSAFVMETILGYPVIDWERKTVDDRDVDFIIDANSSKIFCEVKSPGWEGELTEDERKERIKNGKHIHGEARSMAPWERIRFTIKKSYPKFLPDQRNLLIITDDMFVPLLQWPSTVIDIALFERFGIYDNEKGCFADEAFANIGGVLIWNASDVEGHDEIEYKYKLILNKMSSNQLSLFNI